MKYHNEASSDGLSRILDPDCLEEMKREESRIFMGWVYLWVVLQILGEVVVALT